jgi:hypothetical protein
VHRHIYFYRLSSLAMCLFITLKANIYSFHPALSLSDIDRFALLYLFYTEVHQLYNTMAYLAVIFVAFLSHLPTTASATTTSPQTLPPVISCTVGIDYPCLPSSTCTPMQISTSGKPWLGQCIATPTPAPTPTHCTVGNDKPCLPSSTCTPTMISTVGQPWLGQCIATPTPAPTPTHCTVGNDKPCLPSSTCTPTQISTSGKPWLGQCIATPTPAPTPTHCTVGNDKPCLPSSTCTPTMISTVGQPWLGQCIATPTPTGNAKKCRHVHGKWMCEIDEKCVNGWCVRK